MGIIVAVVLTLDLLSVSVQATTQASIEVDSHPLFQVSRAVPLTADERANLINLRLQQLVQSQSPVQIKIEVRNQSPTIVVNDQHLLTVTQSDVEGDRTTTEQANLWAEQLRQALQQAQQERSAGFLTNALLLAVGTLALAIALHQGLGWLWWYIRQAVLQRFAQPPMVESIGTDSPKALNLLLSLTLIGVRSGLWIVTALYITNLFPASRNWGLATVHSISS